MWCVLEYFHRYNWAFGSMSFTQSNVAWRAFSFSQQWKAMHTRIRGPPWLCVKCRPNTSHLVLAIMLWCILDLVLCCSRFITADKKNTRKMQMWISVDLRTFFILTILVAYSKQVCRIYLFHTYNTSVLISYPYCTVPSPRKNNV